MFLQLIKKYNLYRRKAPITLADVSLISFGDTLYGRDSSIDENEYNSNNKSMRIGISDISIISFGDTTYGRNHKSNKFVKRAMAK